MSSVLAAPRPRRLELSTVLCSLVLAAVALCVVFPLVLVALQSLQVAPPGQPARYGLDGWRAALGEPGLRAALVNTLTVTFVRQLLSLPLAVLVAWLLARTDLPGRGWIEFAFWAAFFLPPFTVTLSWILLLDPEYGLVNTALARLPFVPSALEWLHAGRTSVVMDTGKARSQLGWTPKYSAAETLSELAAAL